VRLAPKLCSYLEAHDTLRKSLLDAAAEQAAVGARSWSGRRAGRARRQGGNYYKEGAEMYGAWHARGWDKQYYNHAGFRYSYVARQIAPKSQVDSSRVTAQRSLLEQSRTFRRDVVPLLVDSNTACWGQPGPQTVMIVGCGPGIDLASIAFATAKPMAATFLLVDEVAGWEPLVEATADCLGLAGRVTFLNKSLSDMAGLAALVGEKQPTLLVLSHFLYSFLRDCGWGDVFKGGNCRSELDKLFKKAAALKHIVIFELAIPRLSEGTWKGRNRVGTRVSSCRDGWAKPYTYPSTYADSAINARGKHTKGKTENLCIMSARPRQRAALAYEVLMF
jgi:hypothetical protein